MSNTQILALRSPMIESIAYDDSKNAMKYDLPGVGHIKAILDWEMTTVADPLMDLGVLLSYWAEAEDGAFEKSMNLSWLPGNLSRAAVADRYAAKSGRDISNLLFYYVFGLFKNTVVIQQVYGRWKKGLTTDERYAGLLFGVKTLVQKAMVAVETGRV